MAFNTIKIKKYSDVIEEYAAGAVITPGELLEVTSAGVVQAHSTAGGNAFPMFALEDELQGHAIWDDFASGDKVQCWIPYRGDIVYGILADGEHVEIGDFLESNGTGYLRKHVTIEASSGSAALGIDVLPLSIVGVSLTAIDISAGSDQSAIESEGNLGTNVRIQVRIV